MNTTKKIKFSKKKAETTQLRLSKTPDSLTLYPPRIDSDAGIYSVYVRTSAQNSKEELGLNQDDKFSVCFTAQGLDECCGLIAKTIQGQINVEINSKIPPTINAANGTKCFKTIDVTTIDTSDEE